MKLVIKGYALKRKSEEKQSQVSALEDSLEILKEKQKKVMQNVINTLPFVHIDTVTKFPFLKFVFCLIFLLAS